MRQSRDLQNLLAVFVQVNQLDLAKKVLGSAFQPQQGLQALGVDKGAFLEVYYEIDDLLLVDVLLGSLAGGMSFEEIQAEYDLVREDILAALRFAESIVEQDRYFSLTK